MKNVQEVSISKNYDKLRKNYKISQLKHKLTEIIQADNAGLERESKSSYKRCELLIKQLGAYYN